MRKKRILIHTNAPWLKTGLAENGKFLANHLYKTDKYEIAYYCSQTQVGDSLLNSTPWKSYGCIPNDQRIINQLNQNPQEARNVSYGSYYIDQVVKEFKPDIYLGSDDIWSFPGFTDKNWWSKIHSMLHITIDSRPVLEEAFMQAQKTKNYITWAKFGELEMKRCAPQLSHIKSVYGMTNISNFTPISKEQKNELRKRFNISPTTKIIGKVGRNQLRKEYVSIMTAFAEFKKQFPLSDLKLHFHTSFSEKGNGWDIPKMIGFLGIKPEDILCTYVCKECGQWHVRPYGGEDIDCPYCGAKKSNITANIAHGVPPEEMKLLYGLWDAGINAHTSGGQELNCTNTLLCGLPLGCTNYASGEDFCALPFVYPISYEARYEAGTNFTKAANSIKSIKGFIERIHRMNEKDLREISQRSRTWAEKTFSIENIGAQWENLFDSLPLIDWDNVNLENSIKDEGYAMPDVKDEDEFIDLLYKNILKMDEPKTGNGFQNWKKQLAGGAKREDVYKFFIDVAKKENQNNNKQDFGTLLDNTGKKRGLILIKESIGDCLIVTSLFESFHKQYPNHDLYIMTSPQYFDIFKGNPFVHKVLAYQDFAEQEMLMMGAGQKQGYFDIYLHPGILTQRHLGYLSQSNPLRVKS
jgi:hypothetical protein